jgi:hypothetical protein
MDASYMLSLAETAVFFEVPLLRDAIWKHYDRQTSLKVGIPVSSYILHHTCSCDAYF